MRIRSLDAVRGLAALIVVLHHCVWTYPERIDWIKNTPLRIAVAGGSAVLVFFALSGFVLQLTFAEKDGRRATPFLIKRVMRIYPPFAIAIVIAWALCAAVGPTTVPEASAWFNEDSWFLPPSAGMVAGHLAMTDIAAWRSLDNVMWSLVVEMRMSLLFPLLACCVAWSWRATLAASLAISIASAWMVEAYPADRIIDPSQTLLYLDLFVGGAIIAEKRRAIGAWITALPSRQRVALWIVALGLFATPSNAAYGAPATAAALLILALSLSDREADAVLARPATLWLGRVSYSLYLVHLPILLVAVRLLHGRWPLFAILALAVAISLIAAELLHRLVERPSMALGSRLAATARAYAPNGALQRRT